MDATNNRFYREKADLEKTLQQLDYKAMWEESLSIWEQLESQNQIPEARVLYTTIIQGMKALEEKYAELRKQEQQP